MDTFPIPCVAGRMLDADVSLPGSKSVTNRCLLMAALASGCSRLEQALISEDTLVFAECLRRMGIPVEVDHASAVFRVDGTGGQLGDRDAELWIGNAGTAARFVTPLAMLGRAAYTCDGVAPMRKRPMRELLEVLEQQGAMFRWLGESYHFPFVIQGPGALPGGSIAISAARTSQQVTGLLMCAPYSKTSVTLRMKGNVVSRSYLDMTCGLMSAWGALVRRPNPETFVIDAGQRFHPMTYVVEPDASSASYFFAAAAILGGRVRVRHLSGRSLQGDLRFVDVLGAMGCKVTKGEDFVEVSCTGPLRGVDVDMNDISDTAPTLAALAPFADGPVTIRNVEHMRWKETDRIAAVVTELRRVGITVTELRDGIVVQPGSPRAAEIETYEDHRIAMSFSILGLRSHGIAIRNPDCVSKTFPTFFECLARILPPASLSAV